MCNDPCDNLTRFECRKSVMSFAMATARVTAMDLMSEWARALVMALRRLLRRIRLISVCDSFCYGFCEGSCNGSDVRICEGCCDGFCKGSWDRSDREIWEGICKASVKALATGRQYEDSCGGWEVEIVIFGMAPTRIQKTGRMLESASTLGSGSCIVLATDQKKEILAALASWGILRRIKCWHVRGHLWAFLW